ncbi:MAG: DNA repair protein RecO [Candidatus Marinimicrobia bacterium]|jgi:DNA repair protein RecO (recombination protein O)|nr:DNA repair protein RecO [Candidatus Neomarinimicrobiota bacterium]|tara:strand:- start:18816 stop:19502 length:687 start_codon:yes stop_codon:yes gene_type:complete
MITNSTAIVLKRFPYSETSIIARCLLRDRGKVSFIIHGAHRKKSPKSAYFQPINCLDLIYYFKETRDLQTVSKVSFFHSWHAIPADLKKLSYAMAMIELTDKCLKERDPHPDLFDELVNALKTVENEKNQLNLAYWFYQYQLLKLLGFKPDFTQGEVDYVPLPNPFAGPNSKAVFEFFQNGQSGIHRGLNITAKDRKVISSYLNTCMGTHFEDVQNLKSFQVLREIVT